MLIYTNNEDQTYFGLMSVYPILQDSKTVYIYV